jgi:hypothetical protein
MEQTLQQPDIWQTLLVLIQTLGTLIAQLAALGFHWLLWIVWLAWWLGGVNAKKTRYVLSIGGWAPAVLLVILSAIAWSRMDARPANFLGLTLPNFWWQLLYVIMLALTALFCGWLQSVFHWTPHEIQIDPEAHGHHPHGHGHDHGHGHVHGHGHEHGNGHGHHDAGPAHGHH